jgi:hypothetical protein
MLRQRLLVQLLPVMHLFWHVLHLEFQGGRADQVYHTKEALLLLVPDRGCLFVLLSASNRMLQQLHQVSLRYLQLL